MTRSDLAARLLATFRGELEEQLRDLDGTLLALEQDPADAELLKRVFRSAHTLKGAAHAAGIADVERICHRMEARLAAARDRRLQLDTDAFAQLFADLNALASAAEALAAAAPRRNAGAADGARDADEPAAAGAAATREAAPPAPATAARAAPGAGAPVAPASATPVRVAEQKLDTVLAGAAELLSSIDRLEGELARAAALPRATLAEARRARQLATGLREDVRRLRLRPFADACDPLPRLVRDVAAASGKDVRLDVTGEEVEADRAVLDAVRDALRHLVRNAVDHGLESPDARVAAGKPRTGTVRIDASLRGDRLLIRLSDDGRGLDLAALGVQLARRGLEPPSDDDAWRRLLLAGGLSSRTEATTISGRGVGVDSARAVVERVHGTLDVSWVAGQGTSFVIDCPVTLALQRLVLASAGGHLVAFPSVDVERLERVPLDEIRSLGGRDVLPHEDGPIPVASLGSVLMPAFDTQPEPAKPLALLRLRAGSRRAAVVVDDFVTEEELLIQTVDRAQRHGGAVAGVTLVDGERVALVLRTAIVVDSAERGSTSGLDRMRGSSAPELPHILVVDDSITTRTLERNVLEGAGFRVTAAPDGAEAWRLLQENDFDLVLSDIEMPRMDGFELCRSVRASKRLERLPIVLLTALESAEQRARGLELGADAYLLKSAFDQDRMIDIIRQLVGADA
ncbi:MAG TPA: response regulator [Longimicrobiales bacterium]